MVSKSWRAAKQVLLTSFGAILRDGQWNQRRKAPEMGSQCCALAVFKHPARHKGHKSHKGINVGVHFGKLMSNNTIFQIWLLPHRWLQSIPRSLPAWVACRIMPTLSPSSLTMRINCWSVSPGENGITKVVNCMSNECDLWSVLKYFEPLNIYESSSRQCLHLIRQCWRSFQIAYIDHEAKPNNTDEESPNDEWENDQLHPRQQRRAMVACGHVGKAA